MPPSLTGRFRTAAMTCEQRMPGRAGCSKNGGLSVGIILSVGGLCVAAIMISSAAAEQPAASRSAAEKARIARTVYARISRAVGDFNRPPELELRPAGSPRPPSAAWYEPDKKIIVVDEEVFDLCDALGAGKPDAELAVVLGHELAHFYRHHDWGGDFGNHSGSALPPRLGVKDVEADADYFGGLFAYLAGYDTAEIGPRVYESIYHTYGFKDDPHSGYLPLKVREQLASEAAERVKALIPIFEAGTRLLMIGEWQKAARCFDEISKEFPGREILNNAGAARAMEASTLFVREDVAGDAPWARFNYPLMPDAHSRLGIRVMGVGEDRRARRDKLLEEALDLVTSAKAADRDYVPAVINLASIYQLRGRPDHAMPFAEDAVAMARRSGDEQLMANALIVRGIIHAALADATPGIAADEHKRARADFESAAAHNPLLAQLNLRALDTKPGDFKPIEPPAHEKDVFGVERIAGLTPEQKALVGPSAPTKKLLRYLDASHPELMIYVRDLPEARVVGAGSEGQRAFFVTTKADYRGQSAEGIKLNDTLAHIKERYGEPSRVVPWRQYMSYVYLGQAQIIFTVDHSQDPGGRVIAWTIYGTEQ